MKIIKFGEILLKKGLIARKQLEFSLEVQKKTKQKIGQVLKYYNLINDEEVGRALAEQIGWKYFDKNYIPEVSVVNSLGIKFLHDKLIFPAKDGDRCVFVLPGTDDTETTDYLIQEGYKDVDFVIGAENSLRYALNALMWQTKREKFSQAENKKEETINADNLKNWFESLLDRAISQGATDIHIEPLEKITQIRLRIDGVLQFVGCIPQRLHANLTNIVFYKADVTVSDFLKFHDARFYHNYLNRTVDIRVSCLPSIHGPTLVLRLLDKSKTLIPLTLLGYHKDHWQRILQAGKLPYGIILVTGPTGSGKTTTLYAILNYLKSLSTKIITIEEPVEMELPLITQVQINETQGVTFHKSTRAFLRHDPDIILIGEIRDAETAAQAVRASVTGHKVFSTLHTNTPIDSLLRLTDLGVNLSHIAGSLICVISQRLVRKLCPFCKKEITVKKNSIPEIQRKYLGKEKERVFKAIGCEKCVEGYWGRTVVAEVLLIGEALQNLITKKKISSIRKILSEDPEYITLVKDASRLVLSGVTSLEEVARVIG